VHREYVVRHLQNKLAINALAVKTWKHTAIAARYCNYRHDEAKPGTWKIEPSVDNSSAMKTVQSGLR